MAVPSRETLIWMALRAGIDAARGSIPAAWPGDGYTPGSAAYLSVADPNAPPVRLFIGNETAHEYRGILSLVYRAPLSGFVYEVHREAVGQIIAAFPENRCLRFHGMRITIPNRPSLQSSYRDGGWFHIPINIPFEATA
jgi:hypothetical protein